MKKSERYKVIAGSMFFCGVSLSGIGIYMWSSIPDHFARLYAFQYAADVMKWMIGIGVLLIAAAGGLLWVRRRERKTSNSEIDLH
jgi:LPXTG-motif cell wall-anchored protein